MMIFEPNQRGEATPGSACSWPMNTLVRVSVLPVIRYATLLTVGLLITVLFCCGFMHQRMATRETDVATVNAMQDLGHFLHENPGKWPKSWKDLRGGVDRSASTKFRFDLSVEKIFRKPSLISEAVKPRFGWCQYTPEEGVAELDDIMEELVYLALRTGDHDRLTAYLKGGGDPNRTIGTDILHGTQRYSLLSLAIVERRPRIAWLLLDHGAEPNGAGEIVLPDERTVKILGEREFPLWYAAGAGEIELVEELVRRGVPINTQRYGSTSPLHEAAIGDHAAVVEFLIKSGADVNQRTSCFAYDGADNATALDLAKHFRNYGARSAIEYAIKLKALKEVKAP